MDVGTLVARLRRERGITQQGLAHSIGKATSTVVRVEHNNGTWPPSTARQVFEILSQSLPLSDEDAFAFLDSFGLSRAIHTAAPVPPSAQAPQRESQHDAAVRATQEALKILSTLFDHLGPAETVQRLRRLLDELGDQGVTVVHPPKPSSIPGATEQEFVTYSTKPKSAAAIKRTAKRS